MTNGELPTIIAAMMTDSEKLLAEIEDFSREAGMAETTFGKKAVNDGKFVARLRDGRRVWPETAAKVRDFIAAFRDERKRAEGEAA